MKKLLIGFFVLIWSMSFAHAEEFYLPNETQAINRMNKRALDQWYRLPVVRNHLEDAYNDPQYSSAQKAYIAKLVREVEAVSEERYRITPWYDVSSDGTQAKLYGNVDSSIMNKTNNLINQNPNLQDIEVVYVPWSTHDINNHLAGRNIRAAGISTSIKKHGFIASGGTDFLMAGSTRTIHPEAKIWVHAWFSDSTPEPWNLPATDPAHDEYLDYFTDMGISSSLYRWILQNTRPGTIHWLSSQDVQNYGF